MTFSLLRTSAWRSSHRHVSTAASEWATAPLAMGAESGGNGAVFDVEFHQRYRFRL